MSHRSQCSRLGKAVQKSLERNCSAFHFFHSVVSHPGNRSSTVRSLVSFLYPWAPHLWCQPVMDGNMHPCTEHAHTRSCHTEHMHNAPVTPSTCTHAPVTLSMCTHSPITPSAYACFPDTLSVYITSSSLSPEQHSVSAS